MEITQDILKVTFEYVEESGNLRWKIDRKFGPKTKGKLTSQYTRCGYKSVQLFGVRYSLHRLIWIYHNGNIPMDKIVDHIKEYEIADNRIENLQLLTPQQNMLKQLPRKNCKSSYKGVSKDERYCKQWRCYFTNNKKKLYIGSYETELEAAIAYDIEVYHHGYVSDKKNFPENDYSNTVSKFDENMKKIC